MSTLRRFAAALISPVAAVVLALVGCTAAPGAQPGTPPASDTATDGATAAPTPSSTFAIPADPVPGEVASAVAERLATPPSASSVAGPGVLDAGTPFVVEGECIGTSAAFRITTADPDDAGRVLVEGTLDCADPRTDGAAYALDYAGPVQLTFTDTDGIDRGWLRVVQRP